MSEKKQGFFARNKKYIIGSLVVYVLLLLVLVLGADGEMLPFVYQVF
jgi:hypothetical protein